ncbi:MAG: HupE/UreJ family protein, partial [Gammaproteobacteria bacterium]|nr:HupE/UreJ family protein [Gammaproteobacteria bacterium]
MLLLFPGVAGAHEIRPAIATATFSGTERYEIEISANLEALLAGVSPVHADTNDSPNAQTYNRLRTLSPAELRAQFRKVEADYLAGIIVEFDHVRALPAIAAVEIPGTGDIRVARISRVRLAGTIPPGAREFRWSYAATLGNSILRLPGHAPGETVALWLGEGALSDPYVLGVGLKSMTRLEAVQQYTVLGFTHILPKGLDHILFVLGLFLLATRFKPLLWQVTSFTVAHSITLGLTIYGVFSLPATVVEPLIAASIVYVAVENMLTGSLHPWRVLIVFGFGLLHGMGFADVLREVGLPRAEFLTGLISFNVGVELGQLTVILLAFLAVGYWFRERAWYRQRIVVPASALIAL